MRILRLCAIAAAICLLGCAGSAYAAFPGGNGILAVQPLHGAGLILTHSDGTDQHRICATAAAECETQRAGRPQFSPDGRTILFAGPVLRQVATGGSCVACDLSAGVSPAFLTDGEDWTFVAGGRLREEASGRLRQRSPAPGLSGVTDATWSASGELALVAKRRVWIGVSGQLQSVGTGTAPDWSPDSASLVVVRRGWVTLIRVSNGRARRLVRGTAPAFSPDGRWVAFIGSEHRLELIPADGGTVQPVGTVRGRSVAWQPLPANPSGCSIPARATVLVSTAQVQLTSGPTGSSTALTECLVTSGVQLQLAKSGPNEDGGTETTYGPAAVDGNYLAVVTDEEDGKEEWGRESVQVYDVQTGQPAGHGGETAPCAVAPCGISSIAVGSGGVTAVATQGVSSPDDLQPLCATASLCLATDSFGQLLTSTTPTQGAWGVASGVTIPAFSGSANGGGNGGTSAGSCPSVNLCVIVEDGVIYTSTDPAAGVWAASAPILPPGSLASLQASPVSCPSTTLCVAIAGNGQIAVSTDPAGGASAWSLEDIDGTVQLLGIACPSISECLVSDGQGNVFSTSDPTGGAGAWTAVKLPTSLWQIVCPSTSLCVGRIGDAEVGVSTDPAAGTWTFTNMNVQSISCPSVSLCVAADDGSISYSTDPASGNWSSYAVSQDAGSLTNIACPTTTLCVASEGQGGPDSGGEVLVSTDPADGASTWTPVLADQINCAVVTRACGTGQIIASDSAGVRVVDSSTAYGDEGLADLAIQGDTLTWDHSGAPRSAQLTP